MAKTTIDLDEKLVRKAMLFSGAKTKREVIDLVLREFVSRRGQMEFLREIASGKFRGAMSMSGKEFLAQRWTGREKAKKVAKLLRAGDHALAR